MNDTRCPLPATERFLLGPGPSMIAPRVMRALGAPVLGHLDPDLLAMMDEMRGQLQRLFRAPDGSLAFAVSGTGTSGLETVVANLVQDGTRVLAVVTGYFGDRLAQVCERYGGQVTRLDVEWGRACDPQRVRDALDAPAGRHRLRRARRDLDRRPQPGRGHRRRGARARRAGDRGRGDLARRAPARDGEVGHRRLLQLHAEVHRRAVRAWRRSRSRPRRSQRRVPCRSFYFDLTLLEEYWRNRKYHHTISSSLVYALHEALAAIEEEGLEARWARHERHHQVLAARARRHGARPAAARGRAAVDAECRDACPTAWTRRACAATCSRGSTWRSAPASGRSPGRSGASA